MTQNTRNKPVDIIRGLAIISLVIDHCIGWLPTVLEPLEVPAWFIVAGMFFRPGKSYMAFAGSKLLRFGVPFVFFSLLYLIVAFPTMLPIRDFGVKWALGCTLLHPANATLWFLKALVWALLLFWPLSRIIGPGRHPWWWLAMTVVLAVPGCITSLYCESIPDVVTGIGIVQGVQALPLMAFGSFVSAFCLQQRFHKWWIALFVAVCAVGVWLLTSLQPIEMHMCWLGDAPWLLYVSAIAVFTFLLLITQNLIFTGWLQYYGRNSLECICWLNILIMVERYAGLESVWWIFLLTLVMLIPAIELTQQLIPFVVGGDRTDYTQGIISNK